MGDGEGRTEGFLHSGNNRNSMVFSETCTKIRNPFLKTDKTEISRFKKPGHLSVGQKKRIFQGLKKNRTFIT